MLRAIQDLDPSLEPDWNNIGLTHGQVLCDHPAGPVAVKRDECLVCRQLLLLLAITCKPNCWTVSNFYNRHYGAVPSNVSTAHSGTLN